MGGRATEIMQAWSPARLFLIVSALWHLLVGSAGFVASSSFPIGAAARVDESAHFLGIFETNGWHNLAGLVLGLASLAFAMRPERARFGALSLGTSMVVRGGKRRTLRPARLEGINKWFFRIPSG